MPNRRQAIIWTNADPVHGCIYTALGWDDFTPQMLKDSVAHFKYQQTNEISKNIIQDENNFISTEIPHRKMTIINDDFVSLERSELIKGL